MQFDGRHLLICICCMVIGYVVHLMATWFDD
jgi:hypothetical protein